MQAKLATAESAPAHETAARLGALWSHLFLSDRGEHLRVIEATGLSITQCKVLFLLEDEEARSVGEIATRLGVSVAAISRAVDGLVQQRQATRTEDPEDRRARRIAIAARGRQIVQRITAARMAVLEQFVQTLSAAERRRLDAALAPLIERQELAPAYSKLMEVDAR